MPKNPDLSYEEHDRFSLEEIFGLYVIKLYAKNTSESPHVDRNQKKMKHGVIFQFLN